MTKTVPKWSIATPVAIIAYRAIAFISSWPNAWHNGRGESRFHRVPFTPLFGAISSCSLLTTKLRLSVILKK